jgi:2-methylcitrate dehydratase PrpD
MPEDTILQELARFALETGWAALPPPIVRETKLLLMDSVGCVLGALATEKGKINVALAERYGGPPEASVIGTDKKVSLSTAALVNGELMFTMDFTAMVAGGNEPAYVIPAILAAAESSGASGKELILATAVGLEISSRLARAVLRQVIDPKEARPMPPLKLRRTGNAYSNFGAAAGVARLLKLDEEKTAHALGIAGHLCKVMTHGRYGSAGRRWTLKYGAPGWQSTGAITAALYAQMGYTGDLTQLDDAENGFWYFAGYQAWQPAKITADLAKAWLYNYRMHYKPYPCCSLFHGALDCFCEIIDKNNLKAEEIEKVHIFGRVGMDHPLYGNPEIKTIADAEFNPRYFFSAAAHRVRPGIAWLDRATMQNPDILKFMAKVTFEENRKPGAPSRCEVVARGKTFTAEKEFSRGTVGTPAAMADDGLIGKFRHNATRALPAEKIERAVRAFMELETIDNCAGLVREITR